MSNIQDTKKEITDLAERRSLAIGKIKQVVNELMCRYPEGSEIPKSFADLRFWNPEIKLSNLSKWTKIAYGLGARDFLISIGLIDAFSTNANTEILLDDFAELIRNNDCEIGDSEHIHDGTIYSEEQMEISKEDDKKRIIEKEVADLKNELEDLQKVIEKNKKQIEYCNEGVMRYEERIEQKNALLDALDQKYKDIVQNETLQDIRIVIGNISDEIAQKKDELKGVPFYKLSKKKIIESTIYALEKVKKKEEKRERLEIQKLNAVKEDLIRDKEMAQKEKNDFLNAIETGKKKIASLEQVIINSTNELEEKKKVIEEKKVEITEDIIKDCNNQSESFNEARLQTVEKISEKRALTERQKEKASKGFEIVEISNDKVEYEMDTQEDDSFKNDFNANNDDSSGESNAHINAEKEKRLLSIEKIKEIKAKNAVANIQIGESAKAQDERFIETSEKDNFNENRDNNIKNIIEFIGLIKGISFDGVINDAEIVKLENWVNINRYAVHNEEQINLLDLVDEVIEDHIVTHEERITLLIQAEKVLKARTSDYSKIYELNGIISGIICDGVVNVPEMENLCDWLEHNEQFVLEHELAKRILDVIDEIFEDGKVTVSEQKYLLEVLNDIVNESQIDGIVEDDRAERELVEERAKKEVIAEDRKADINIVEGDNSLSKQTKEDIILVNEKRLDKEEVCKSAQIKKEEKKNKELETSSLACEFFLFPETMDNQVVEEKDLSFDERLLLDEYNVKTYGDLLRKSSFIFRDCKELKLRLEEKRKNLERIPLYSQFGLTIESLDENNRLLSPYELSTRLYNALRRNNTKDLKSILLMSPNSIETITNIGQKSLGELFVFVHKEVFIESFIYSNKAKADIVQSNEIENIQQNVKTMDISVSSIACSFLVFPYTYNNKDLQESLLGLDDKAIDWLNSNNINSVYELLLSDVALVSDSYFGNTIKRAITRIAKESERVPIYEQFGIKNSELNNYNEEIGYGYFSVRLARRLKRNSIFTLKELIELPMIEIKNIRNIGATSLKELYLYINNKLSHKEVANNETVICNIKDKKNTINDRTLESLINEEYIKIPYSRRKNKLKGYLMIAGLSSEQESVLCTNSNETIKDLYMDVFMRKDERMQRIAIRFFQKCTFDLTEDITAVFDILNDDKREKDILVLRSEKRTLEEIGKRMDLSRERIRQIEKKAMRKMASAFSRKKILLKIYADRNCDDVLTSTELEEYFGEKTNLAMYILKSNSNRYCYYDNISDVFIVGCNKIAEDAYDYINSLDAQLSQDELDDAIREGIENGFNEEMLKIAMSKMYEKSGNTYHTRGLSLKDIYYRIIQKYYPDGIHLYDDIELSEFRNYISKEYGDVELPQNNRAISARITDICILCGRGVYRLEKDAIISKELISDIVDYINRNNMDVIPYSIIFHKFEKELIEEGIDNRYYLQGILRKELDDQFYFKKDYIVKSNKEISFLNQIVKYIESSSTPVSKDAIKNKFKGISDITISSAVAGNEIINMWGSYIHVNRLMIAEEEKQYLKNLIAKCLVSIDYCHIKKLYLDINAENDMLLKRNCIYNPNALFAILEYFFSNYYQFSRPYIGKIGVYIGKPEEIIMDFIRENDVVKIDDILDKYEENYKALGNILDKVDSINNEYLFLNRDEIASLNYIGINSEIADQIETILCDEIKDTVLIRDLGCIHRLPKINVSWNEWLLYSVIKKYSKKFVVLPSNSRLKSAVPVVAPKGMMDLKNIDYSHKDIDSKYMVDDINDLESIAEIVMGEEGNEF